MQISVLGALLGAVITGSAWAAPDPIVERAMERGTRDHLIIDVEVNGEGPYPFVLDTGAQASVVFNTLVDALALERDGDARAQVQGATERREMVFYRLDTVEIGGVAREGLRVVSAPQGAGTAFATYPTYGIIGADILNDYSVEYDFAAGRIRFFAPESDFSDYAAGWSQAGYRMNRVGFSIFDLSVDEVAVEAILDLGASHHVLNHAGSQALGFDPAGAFETTASGRGFNGREVEMPVISDRSLSLGDLALSDVDLSVMDSPVFNLLGMAETPSMFLGLPLFEGRSIIFDRANEQLLISEQT